jgi:hypothetical protein
MKCVRDSRLRVLVSAALLIAVIFFIRSRQTPAPVTGSSPLLSEAPSAEGSARFAWVPRYPGAELQNIQSGQSRTQLHYAFDFLVADSTNKIETYYETQLRALGFTIVTKQIGAGMALHAESEDRKRMIEVKLTTAPQGLQVGVVALQQ